MIQEGVIDPYPIFSKFQASSSDGDELYMNEMALLPYFQS